MARGRPRKSEAEKKLTGNPGKRSAREAGTASSHVELECPDFLPDVAKTKWKATAAKLKRAGRLTAEAEDQLIVYCLAWDQMIQATLDIQTNGIVLFKGDYAYPNPAVTQQRSAWARIDKASERLGLDPVSSASLGGGGDLDDDFDEFLKGGR